MFNFLKKKTLISELPALLPLSTDIHSHILPGIDDGSPDLATSLHLLKGLYDLGIRKSIATPHIIGDLYRNTPQTIKAALDLLRPACEEAGIEIELSAAAEYMLDDHFMGLLKQKEPLLCLHKNIILTELAYSMPPDNLEQMAFAIMTHGYQPVMAHPERYFFYHHDYDQYNRLIELGFILQVNILSLSGYYGKSVAKAARFIIKNGMAALVGTDLHHEKHLAALQDKENLQLFNSYISPKGFNDLERVAAEH